ncbi:MAG: SprB repeat-containing protein, partial [Catalinimonas sp.]
MQHRNHADVPDPAHLDTRRAAHFTDDLCPKAWDFRSPVRYLSLRKCGNGVSFYHRTRFESYRDFTKTSARVGLRLLLGTLLMFGFFSAARAQTIIIQEPVQTTNLNCNGANDGTMTVAIDTAGGLTPPFTYSIVQLFPEVIAVPPITTAEISVLFTSLPFGSYVVTVRDAAFNRATSDAFAFISTPSVVTTTLLGVTNISCQDGEDGSISVIGGSGNGTPYSFSIDSGATFLTNGNNQYTFSGLAAGTYEIITRDNNGCDDPTPLVITLSEPTDGVEVSGVTLVDNASCDGNGEITVSAAGGTPGYEFALDGGAFGASGTFSGLLAGGYTVTVRDANGCTVDTTVALSGPEELAGTATALDARCAGAADGTITVNATGGTVPYRYSADGTNFQNNATLSGLAAGTYTVTILDVNDCATLVENVIIGEPNALDLSLVGTVDVEDCPGEATGEITVSAAGGTPGYEYAVNGGAFGTDSIFTALLAGSYEVVVRDANGCTDTLTNVEIVEPAALTLSVASTSDQACAGDANGEIVVTATGGTPGYTYALNGGAFGTDATFAGLATGVYEVIVR